MMPSFGAVLIVAAGIAFFGAIAGAFAGDLFARRDKSREGLGISVEAKRDGISAGASVASPSGGRLGGEVEVGAVGGGGAASPGSGEASKPPRSAVVGGFLIPLDRLDHLSPADEVRLRSLCGRILAESEGSPASFRELCVFVVNRLNAVESLGKEISP